MVLVAPLQLDRDAYVTNWLRGSLPDTRTRPHSGNYSAGYRGVDSAPRGGQAADNDIYSSHPHTKKGKIEKVKSLAE